jgi:Mor family transcriptional regulator
VDFVDHVFTYLLREFPHLAGPQFAKAKRAVREHLGGDRVYISRRSSEALAHQVLSLFNGRNATEVARSLNISRATVYRVLKQSAPRDGSP